VIPRQRVFSTVDGHATSQHAHLELAQALVPAAIGMRDERGDDDAPLHGGLELGFDIIQIEAEDDDMHGLFRPPDRPQDRGNASVWLND
jgi:hypothetical protein